MEAQDLLAILDDHRGRWARRTAEVEELLRLYDQPWDPRQMRTPAPSDWVSNVHGTIYPRNLQVQARSVLRDSEGQLSPSPVAYESVTAKALNSHKKVLDRVSRLALTLGGAGIRWGWEYTGNDPFSRMAPLVLPPMDILIDDAPEERFRGARFQVTREWYAKTFKVQAPKYRNPLQLPYVWEVYDFVADTVYYVPDKGGSAHTIVDLKTSEIQIGNDDERVQVKWTRIPWRTPAGKPMSPISVLIYDEGMDDPRHCISPLGRRLDIFRAKNASLILAKERAEVDVDTYMVAPELAQDPDFMQAMCNPVPNQVVPMPASLAGRSPAELIHSVEKRASSPAMKEFMALINEELAQTNAAVGAQVMGMATGVTATEVGIAEEYTRQSLSRYRLKFHDFLAENVNILAIMASLLCGDVPWVVPTPEGMRPYTGAYLAQDWDPVVIDMGVQSGTQMEQRREWPGILQILAGMGRIEPEALVQETLRRYQLDPARFPLIQQEPPVQGPPTTTIMPPEEA